MSASGSSPDGNKVDPGHALAPAGGPAIRMLIRWLAWAGLLAYVLLIGGTPRGELNGWVQAINACLALGLITLWVWHAGRESDTLDVVMVGALVLFLVAAVFSVIPRQSFAAATQASGMAAGFYFARRLLAGQARVIVPIVLGWLCLITVATVLPAWVAVWMRWLAATGWSELPPLSVWLPSGIFDNRHYIGTLVLVLAPALWSSQFRKRWPASAIIGTGAAAAVVLMDASRTLVLGGITATVVVAITNSQALMPFLRSRWRVFAVAGTATFLAAAVVAGPTILERLANFQKLLTRVTLWDHGVEVWLSHPFVGVGPGVYPFSYYLTDYFADRTFAPRHPDNALIQLVAEAGLLGVLAGGAVVAGVMKRARQSRRSHPEAVWAITAFLVACVGTNPTDFVFLVTPVLIWAAMLSPIDRGYQIRPRRSMNLRPVLVAALVPVGIGIILTAVGSAAYQLARDALADGSRVRAQGALELAVAVDPSQAFYWRELGALRLVDLEPHAALGALGRARELNPLDPVTGRGISLAELASGDQAAALAEATAAAMSQPHDSKSQLLLSAVAMASGDAGVSRSALSNALLESPYLALVPWTETAIGQASRAPALAIASLSVARLSGQQIGVGPVLLVLLAGSGDPIAAAGKAAPGVAHSARALAAVAKCDARDATRELSLATRTEREDGSYWIAAAVISQVFSSVKAPPNDLLLIFLGLDANSGPRTESLLSAGTGDELRYRRTSIDARSPTVVVPSSFTGRWVLAHDPAAALFPPSGRPASCA